MSREIVLELPRMLTYSTQESKATPCFLFGANIWSHIEILLKYVSTGLLRTRMDWKCYGNLNYVILYSLNIIRVEFVIRILQVV